MIATFALCDVRCALCDVRCALRDVRCAMCDVRCAMCDVRCATIRTVMPRTRNIIEKRPEPHALGL